VFLLTGIPFQEILNNYCRCTYSIDFNRFPAVFVGSWLRFPNLPFEAAHDLLISNQVSKGFEPLASDKIAMRLAASTRWKA